MPHRYPFLPLTRTGPGLRAALFLSPEGLMRELAKIQKLFRHLFPGDAPSSSTFSRKMQSHFVVQEKLVSIMEEKIVLP